LQIGYIRTSLVITVGQYEEDILKDRNVKLAEEDTRGVYVSLGHVVHQLQAHGETGILHLAVIMLRCPHARINDKLELRGIEIQQRLEAIQVDGLEELEELNAMFGILVEILIDHFQGTAENTVHDSGDLILHQSL